MNEGDAAVIEVRALERPDLDTLMEWRMEVLDTVFADERPWDSDALRDANRLYYERAIGSDHIACMVSVDGEDAACGGMCLQDEMPSPDNPSGKCAYIMNVYTRPAFRHQGLASHVIKWLIDEARSRGADKIYLEATGMAAPLYRELGFQPIEGMMKLGSNEE